MQIRRFRQIAGALAVASAVVTTSGCGPKAAQRHDAALPPLPAAAGAPDTPSPVADLLTSPMRAARLRLRTDADQALGVVRRVDRRWTRDRLASDKGRRTKAKVYGQLEASLLYGEKEAALAAAVAGSSPKLTTLVVPARALGTAFHGLATDLSTGTAPAADVHAVSAAGAALVAAGASIKLHLAPGHVPTLRPMTVVLPADPAIARARAARIAARRAVRLYSGLAWGIVRRYVEHAVAGGTFSPAKYPATLARARARLIRALAVATEELALAHRACAPQPKLVGVCAAVAREQAAVTALSVAVHAGLNPTAADAGRLEAAFVAEQHQAAAIQLRIVPRRAPTIS